MYDYLKEKFGWSKDQVDQGFLVSMILLIALVLIAWFVVSNPVVRVGVVSFSILAWSKIVSAFGMATILLGLFLFGHFVVRKVVEYADGKLGKNISIPTWVHWTLCLVLSVTLGWFWMNYAVPELSQLSIETFISNGWIIEDGEFVDKGNWWVVGSISFFLGYFWKGIWRTILDY